VPTCRREPVLRHLHRPLRAAHPYGMRVQLCDPCTTAAAHPARSARSQPARVRVAHAMLLIMACRRRLIAHPPLLLSLSISLSLSLSRAGTSSARAACKPGCRSSPSAPSVEHQWRHQCCSPIGSPSASSPTWTRAASWPSRAALGWAGAESCSAIWLCSASA